MDALSAATKDAMLAQIPKLRAFAYSLCGRELADDMVEETLLRAWDHLDSLQEGTNLRAWPSPSCATHTLWISGGNDASHAIPTAGAARLSVAPAQHGHLELLDWRRPSPFSPYIREALVLVAEAGLSYVEVAEIAECPMGTVKSRTNRARAKLAQILGITGHDNFGPDHVMAAVVERLAGRQRRGSNYATTI